MSPRQRRFIEEYLIDANAAEAARRAGYSERSARSVGAENLTKPDIAAEIQRRMDERAARLKMDADEALCELAILGRSSIADYQIDDRGNVTLADGVAPEKIRAVASIKRRVRHLGEGQVEYTTEIRLWDKNSALEKVGKHLRLYVDQVHQTNMTGFTAEQLKNLSDEELSALERLILKATQPASPDHNAGPSAPFQADESEGAE